MLTKGLKSLIQKFAQSLGYHVLSKGRIAGDMVLLLEGIKNRGLEVKHIVDVGANTGEWSELAAGIFPRASFSLIEPQIEMKPYLEAFATKHKANWILGGAGAEEGSLKLTVWEDNAGSSFLIPENKDGSLDKEQREVPIYTLDRLLSDGKIEVPEICKLDVQGFELEVLKGANALFGKTEIFILEVGLFDFLPGQPRIEEVISFMVERDYVIYDFPGFSNRPIDGALGQVDICFARRNGKLRQNHLWEKKG